MHETQIKYNSEILLVIMFYLGIIHGFLSVGGL